MGSLFSSLEIHAGNLLDIRGSCRAEGVNWNEACEVGFLPNGSLLSIGNIIKGNLDPDPGIAGQGIWLSTLPVFAVLLISILKTVAELINRFEPCRRLVKGRFVKFAEFVDPPKPDPTQWSTKIHAAARQIVLTAADTQIIFVCAFAVSFVAKTKCELTAYRYGVALDIMNIGLSVVVCSVAMVRSYWRHPLTAVFRTVLTVAAFICVALTVSHDSSFAPEWPPASEHQDSAVMLPLACLLDSGLRETATRQADAANARLGFHSSALKWPPERVHFIFLCIACAVAHLSPLCRHVLQDRHVESTTLIFRTWSRGHGWFVALYWLIVLGIPTVVAPWSWYNAYEARVWVRDSGWISTPNTEWDLYNADQLIPGASVNILLTMAVLTELWSTQKKDSSVRASTEQSWYTGMELPQYRLLNPNAQRECGDDVGASAGCFCVHGVWMLHQD